MLVLLCYALVAVLVSLVWVRLDPDMARPDAYGERTIFAMAAIWPLTLLVFGVAWLFFQWSRLIDWYAPAATEDTEAPHDA